MKIHTEMSQQEKKLQEKLTLEKLKETLTNSKDNINGHDQDCEYGHHQLQYHNQVPIYVTKSTAGVLPPNLNQMITTPTALTTLTTLATHATHGTTNNNKKNWNKEKYGHVRVIQCNNKDCNATGTQNSSNIVTDRKNENACHVSKPIVKVADYCQPNLQLTQTDVTGVASVSTSDLDDRSRDDGDGDSNGDSGDSNGNGIGIDNDSSGRGHLFDDNYSNYNHPKRRSKQTALEQCFRIMVNDKDEYEYQCKQCNKIIYTRSGALGHINIHLGIKNYQCSFCKQKFGHKTTRDRHVLIHTGEKPFQCKICHKKFRVKSILKNHHTTHTKEKNYHCNICGKKYAQNSSLLRHTKRKHSD